jgi:hypothetical protein
VQHQQALGFLLAQLQGAARPQHGVGCGLRSPAKLVAGIVKLAQTQQGVVTTLLSPAAVENGLPVVTEIMVKIT